MIILQAEQLTKEFLLGQERITVLDQVQVAIRKGEYIAIVGPSGSGKSTLLSLLSGLDLPTQGKVIFSGAELTALNEDQMAKIWAKKFGFIFQSYHLLPTLTAEENVMVPLELSGMGPTREKAREWLKKVGLAHRLNHLPVQLSGGEQQRVAIARSMVTDPEILFADEPTGNLDSKTGKEVADLIFSVAKDHGTTLVMVTHEDSLAKRADRILELRDGKIVREQTISN